MDKRQAISIIEDTFNDRFDEEKFRKFVINFLNDIEPKNNTYQGNLLWEDYKKYISKYTRIAKYTDPNGDKLDVLVVQVKSLQNLRKARTTLRNFVIKHLNKFEKEHAIVAFYTKEDGGNDWRFSYIKLEYKSYHNQEKGKVDVKKEFTPAKRYSFLVGKDEKTHTAKNQLLPIFLNVKTNPTIEDIEAAFSIEKVTDEFFGQYKSLYITIYEQLQNDNHVKVALEKTNNDIPRFTKKLLGQLVFLYFLQKKGWLGVPQNQPWGNGNKRFVQQLFDIADTNDNNFFKDYLQYLFYEALATERDNVNSYYPKFDCRIPFLNGGLFEAEYDWQAHHFSIPNSLFRNNEKNKAGDTGTGVLDVLDRYNFTIKEDEPLDKEVAVDPEMLGKVFENMLEISERKSKGAFYTPREIVHYMCQESLIHYLDNALNNTAENKKLTKEQINNDHIPKDDLQTYIRHGHHATENDQRVIDRGESRTYQYQLPQSIRHNADQIDQILTEILICDPAIGSGAFPVGLLHELVAAHLVLIPYLSMDYAKSKSQELGFQFRESVHQSRYVYRLKKHIIQESIYGVDIDASAIDIARLRLWLSLVVDEEELDPIETLPNLDYKIVQGNSLIGLPQQGANRYPQLSDKLEKLKNKFFNETDITKKENLKNEINKNINKILDASEDFDGYKIDFDFKLFFSEVWRKKGGFDIVIGNPPYVKEYTNKTAFDGIRGSEYYQGKMDLWYFFVCHLLDMLTCKGNVNFIATNNWVTNSGASKLRNKIVNDAKIIRLIDFGNTKVFASAGIQTMILIAERNSHDQKYDFDYKKNQTEAATLTDLFDMLDGIENPKYSIATPEFDRKLLLDKIFSFNNSQENDLLNKIKSKQNFVLNETKEVAQGIVSPQDFLNKKNKLILGNEYEVGNGIFGLSQIEYERLKFNKKEKQLVKPYYTTDELERFYGNSENNYWIIYTDSSFKNSENIKPYPNIKKHLDKFSKVITSSNRPYGLHRARKEDFFVDEKIIVRRKCSRRPVFTYTDFNCYVSATFFIIKTKRINQKYLTAVLNSELIEFWLLKRGKMQGFNYQVDKAPLLGIPIYKPESTDLFAVIVDYIIVAKKNSKTLKDPQNPFSSVSQFLEQLVDALVYQLYFPEEFRSAGKDILSHLEDIKPIDEGMSDIEKLAVIQSEYQRLSHTSHPIRQALDTLDSIEEVRIIKEALK